MYQKLSENVQKKKKDQIERKLTKNDQKGPNEQICTKN